MHNTVSHKIVPGEAAKGTVGNACTTPAVPETLQRCTRQREAAQDVTDPSRCSAHDRLPLRHAALLPAAACAASPTLAHLQAKLSDLPTFIWMACRATFSDSQQGTVWSGVIAHLPQGHAIQDEHVCWCCCRRHPMGAARSATPGRQPPGTRRRRMRRLQVCVVAT